MSGLDRIPGIILVSTGWSHCLGICQSVLLDGTRKKDNSSGEKTTVWIQCQHEVGDTGSGRTTDDESQAKFNCSMNAVSGICCDCNSLSFRSSMFEWRFDYGEQTSADFS